MLDPKNPDYENETIPIVWDVGCNGLLQGSDDSIIQRTKTMIDQAFTQSPYLAN
jgi:hypothetical protein